MMEEYLKQHGVSTETAKKFNLSAIKSPKYGEQLAIPVYDELGVEQFKKYRNLEANKENNLPKYVFDPGSKETTFNIVVAKTQPSFVIFEGEIDTIKATEDGVPAISGTNGAKSIPEDWKELLKGKDIYLCYDNDPTGEIATRSLLKKFPHLKVVNLPKEFKDYSEYRLKHSKADFAQLLRTAQIKSDWEADHLPEEFSAMTLEEVYKLEFPEEEWLIDRVVPRSGFIMFVGEPGAGKSWTVLDAIKSFITGNPFLGHFEVKEKVNVLVIDKENGLRRLQKRMKGMNIPSSDKVFFLKYPENFRIDEEGIPFMEAIATMIKKNDIKVVFLDSFVDILVGEENNVGDTNQIFDALRSIVSGLEVCYYTLHHDSKPVAHFVKTAAQKTRGSSNILAQLVNQFYISRTKDPSIINIEQGKARDYQPVPKFALKYEQNEEGDMTGFTYLGEVKTENSKLDEAIEFIEEFLTNTPNRTRKDILEAAKDAGIDRGSIDRAMKLLKEKNLVDFVKDGRNKLFFMTGTTIEAEEGGDDKWTEPPVV